LGGNGHDAGEVARWMERMEASLAVIVLSA